MYWLDVPLRKVAPPQASDVHFKPDENVWHLTLDQIESNTGAISNKVMMPAYLAGGSTFNFDEKNVLYSKLRPYLNKVVCPEESGIATTELVPLRPNPDVLDRRFLTYYLRSNRFLGFAHQCVAGVKMPRVIMSKFWEYTLGLPALSEQRRIVEILDQADALRKKRSDADVNAARILPALFLKMFGDPATNPMGWDTVPVSAFVEGFEAGRSLAAKDQESDSATYRVLKVSAVTWGRYQPQESKPVPPDYVPPKNHFVKQGDLLFSRANTTELVGAVAYVNETPPNLLLPDKIWRFIWRDPDEVHPLFVNSLFRHPVIRYELGKRATGTSGSMKNISMGKVLSMEVPLPPSKLQQQFGDFATKISAIELQCNRSRDQIDRLFHRLLHDAFSGELTAKWREGHMKKLLAEIEAQKKALEVVDSQAAMSF
jgi:type I restriction enzyme S subunit